MFKGYTSYIFYVEGSISTKEGCNKTTINFIENISTKNAYFFTHNCDISRKSLLTSLESMGINAKYSNLLVPNYVLINYCKTIYKNLSIYPISSSKDFYDFQEANIKINTVNPDIIFLCSKKISDKDRDFIYSSKVPIVFSSNLCANRGLSCSKCFRNCNIKELKKNFSNRLIIPDMPPIYNTAFLFKQLNIQPKYTVVVTDLLRDDYLQYQRLGCKLVLILNNRTSYEDYLKSPHDADVVVENFEKFSHFLEHNI